MTCHHSSILVEIFIKCSSFYVFHLLDESLCWWNEGPAEHDMGKFYGRFQLIQSLREHQS